MSRGNPPAVDGHIADAVDAMYPGDVLCRWVLVAEVLDADTGQRMTTTLVGDDAQPWDVMGLCTYAIAREQGEVVRRDAQDDD